MALPNRQYINGFGGDVTWRPLEDENGDALGGVPFEFPVASWELTDQNNLIDVTNTSSGLWMEFIGGTNEGSLSLKLFWDANAANTYTSTAHSLVPGTRGEMTLLIGQDGTTPATGNIHCPFVIIQTAKMAVSPKNAVTWDLECKLTGPPDFPGP